MRSSWQWESPESHHRSLGVVGSVAFSTDVRHDRREMSVSVGIRAGRCRSDGETGRFVEADRFADIAVSLHTTARARSITRFDLRRDAVSLALRVVVVDNESTDVTAHPVACPSSIRRQSRCDQPCDPIPMPASTSARTPAWSTRPRSPNTPASRKNSQVRPRSTRRGNATSTSDTFPSSNVIRTSDRSATASSTRSNCATLTQVRSSPGSRSRPTNPVNRQVDHRTRRDGGHTRRINRHVITAVAHIICHLSAAFVSLPDLRLAETPPCG